MSDDDFTPEEVAAVTAVTTRYGDLLLEFAQIEQKEKLGTLSDQEYEEFSKRFLRELEELYAEMERLRPVKVKVSGEAVTDFEMAGLRQAIDETREEMIAEFGSA